MPEKPRGGGMAKRISVIDVERCVGCESCMFACTRRFGVGGTGDARIVVRSVGGIRRGFVVVVCRACPDPPCARVCPTDALTVRDGGGVVFHPDSCLGCGNCADACPYGAVFWDDVTGKPQICVYCGICAQYCPYDVIALEEVPNGAG